MSSWFHDNRTCRSCGKKYRYGAWANKHFWNCPTPNEGHTLERLHREQEERRFLKTITDELQFYKFFNSKKRGGTWKVQRILTNTN